MAGGLSVLEEPVVPALGDFDDEEERPEPIHLSELETPAMVLDLDVLEHNIERMAERMTALGVALRPHFKTHKNLQIAAAQAQYGIVGFTVSTVAEAEALAGAGCRDLTWAFPLIPSRLRRVFGLMRRTGATVRLVVDSPQAVDALEQEIARTRETPLASGSVHVWLKVDCGYHRAGVDPAAREAVELARRLQESADLAFDGILSHSGHAYDVHARSDLMRVAEEERRTMTDFADRLRGRGIAVPGVSVGSTPTMSVVENLDDVTEARPGNYVFYDYTQTEIGSCGVEDCALTVLSTVVSSQPGAQHSVIDAGALSLSKDPGPEWIKPLSYGRIYSDYQRQELDPELRLVSLSQEHGIVNRRLPVGTRVRILPNHSCLTVACHRFYRAARSEMVIEDGIVEYDAH